MNIHFLFDCNISDLTKKESLEKSGPSNDGEKNAENKSQEPHTGLAIALPAHCRKPESRKRTIKKNGIQYGRRWSAFLWQFFKFIPPTGFIQRSCSGILYVAPLNSSSPVLYLVLAVSPYTISFCHRWCPNAFALEGLIYLLKLPSRPSNSHLKRASPLAT